MFFWSMILVYIFVVLVLGVVCVWLFFYVDGVVDNSLMWVVVMVVVGCLFVIFMVVEILIV